MKNDEWFRNRAKELYHEEGEIEVDDDARASSGGDGGAYVEAWVWVPFQKERANSRARGHLRQPDHFIEGQRTREGLVWEFDDR